MSVDIGLILIVLEHRESTVDNFMFQMYGTITTVNSIDIKKKQIGVTALQFNKREK